MNYQLVNKRTKTLPLATSHIAHLCKQFNHAFALLISMQRFKSINFYQNRPKGFFAKKKIQNFRAQGAPPPDLRNYLLHYRFLATRMGTRKL